MKYISFLNRNISLLFSKLYYSFFRKERNLWVMGEWFGERCCDNCMYLANYVANNHPEVHIVWITCADSFKSKLSPRINICRMDSGEALNALKRASVVIMNQGREDLTSNKYSHYYSGALAINLWHGVAWKKISLDAPISKFDHIYIGCFLNLFVSNIYLSTSEGFSDILLSAFSTDRRNIIKSGYPRNSIFYSPDKLRNSKKDIKTLLGNRGLKVSTSTKIVTYMPTFRDRTESQFSFHDITENQKLLSVLEEHDAVVIQKSHFVTTRRKTENSQSRRNRIVQIDEYNSQELLAASDVLITDYSSCFFDFLILDRPIIHYLYDYEYYANDDRGVYYKKEDVVGGDVAETVDELIAAIDESLRNPDKNKALRQQRRDKYMRYESKNSCEQIYNEIIKRIDGNSQC